MALLKVSSTPDYQLASRGWSRKGTPRERYMCLKQQQPPRVKHMVHDQGPSSADYRLQQVLKRIHSRHHRSLQVRVPAAEEAKAKQQEVQEAPVVVQ